MTIDLELAGTRHSADVRREGDRWSVTLGGRRLTASVTETAGHWSLLLGSRSFEIAIDPRARGELVVHVNGRAVAVTIDGRRRRRRESGAAAATGPTAVVAPMPGRIVKVLVASGEVVEARQPLVVVEAMKMENELRAPRAGSVTDVRVSEGMSVEANAVLMVIV